MMLKEQDNEPEICRAPSPPITPTTTTVNTTIKTTVTSAQDEK